MQNNPSIAHMMMAVACILLLSVIAQANGHATWLEVYHSTLSAVFASILSRLFAGFN